MSPLFLAAVDRGMRLLTRSVDEVAALIGVPQGRYSLWETGRERIPEKYKTALGRVFNVPYAEVDNGVEDK